MLSVPIIESPEITFRKRSGSVLMQSHIPSIIIDNKECGGSAKSNLAPASMAASEAASDSAARRRRSTMGGALLEAAAATANVVSFSSNPPENNNHDVEATIQSGSNIPFRRTSIVDASVSLPSTSVPFSSANKVNNNVSLTYLCFP